jgi:hypothetical protein
VGETLACAPLIALAMGEREEIADFSLDLLEEPRVLGGLWRGRLATLSMGRPRDVQHPQGGTAASARQGSGIGRAGQRRPVGRGPSDLQ